MAKTSPSDVWHKPIKEEGNGYIDLICACVDVGAGGLKAGVPMLPSTTGGNFTAFVTADPDAPSNLTVAEDIVDDDRYFLGRKRGAKILHNQKLAGAYGIGHGVYKTGAGTWTELDHDAAASLIVESGIVCGPADRITGGDVKDIDDALSATEGVDICV